MAKKTTTDKPTAKAKAVTVEDLTELRLLEMGAENYKRVKLVRLRPAGNPVTVSGRNGQGKSSTLDAFTSLFEGKAGVAKMPIRAGETEATSYAILGRDGEPLVTISQRIWQKKDRLGELTGDIGREILVEGADGRPFTHPQTLATALFAPIAFDPFAEFLRKPEKDKVDLLKSLVAGFDFAENEREVAKLRLARTETGRDFERAKAAAAAIDVSHNLPAEPIDEQAMVESLGTVATHNAGIDERARRRAAAAAERDSLLDQIEMWQAQIATAEQRINAITAQIDTAEPLPDKMDVTKLQAQIAAARVVNADIARRQQKDAYAADAKRLGQEYDKATTDIETLLAAKRKAVADAKLPVKGLEFDEAGVTLNGVPFEDASSAEQLRASALLAMAVNPDLRVIVIREGSLLDPDQLEMLAALATERGFDLIVERVTDGSGAGIVIEDGEVAS